MTPKRLWDKITQKAFKKDSGTTMYSFTEIVERIKKIKGFTNDEEVAKALRWNVQALNTAKTNDNIPYELSLIHI